MTQTSRTSTPPSKWDQVWLNETLPLPRADVILLVHSFATAIIDVFTFTKFSVFVANMTGNSIFLGLGIAGIQIDYLHPDRSVVALISFWVGSYLTGLLGTHYHPKRRIYLFLIFLSQSLLLFLSSALLYTSTFGSLETNPSKSNLALIFLLALAFGSQAAAGRPLGVNAITTVVVTSAMVDFFSDPNLLAPLSKNKVRNQRGAFIVIFFVGGMIGGVILRFVGEGTTVLVAAIVKLGGAGVFLFMRGEGEGRVEDVEEEVPPEREVEVISSPSDADAAGTGGETEQVIVQRAPGTKKAGVWRD